MTATVQQNGKSWFAKAFDINTPYDYVNFVFAKDEKTQTVDMSGITTDTYFEVQDEQDDQGHYLVRNITGEQPTGIFGIADVEVSAKPTTVVSFDGRTLRRYPAHVTDAEALSGLASGMYVVNGKKVIVR